MPTSGAQPSRRGPVRWCRRCGRRRRRPRGGGRPPPRRAERRRRRGTSTSFIEISPPPATLATSPGSRSAAAAARLAATTSSTKVKSRTAAAVAGQRETRCRRSAGLEDAVDRHVGALPGSVDGEVAEGDGAEAPVGRVEAAQVLAGQLGDTVRRVRAGQVVLAGRVARRLPVDRRARGVDEPGCAHRGRRLRAAAGWRGRCGWRTPRSRRTRTIAPRPARPGGTRRRRRAAARRGRPAEGRPRPARTGCSRAVRRG